MQIVDPRTIIRSYYPADDALRRMLIHHSQQVRDKALEIARKSGVEIDSEFVAAAAMLHDLGIKQCHAPSIHCHGTADYIAHGVIGAGMLRDYGAAHGLDLEPYARVCERHTGSGLTAADIKKAALPLPERDFLPETAEEILIALADKFFSKSGDMLEKSLTSIRRGMQKFGDGALARFDQMCARFKIQ